MKHIFLSLLTVLLLTGGLPPRQRQPRPNQTPSAPVRRALLVGAWDYPPTPDGDFPPLKSGGRPAGPVEDVKALKSVLVKRLQFKDEEVKVLTTRAETTRRAILDAFRSFLIEPAGEGAVVFFHYSGHGSQLPDEDILDERRRPLNQNPSADEPDGLDETLVPTDHGPEGENEIRDDDINRLIRELMTKRPASVVLTFDSCHSGTVVRGGALARGRSWDERALSARRKPASRARAAAGQIGDGLLDPGAAESLDYVTLSAARERERAWQVFDGRKQMEMGRFTSALATALDEAGPTTTYEDLFRRVRAVMANLYADQHPQLEGRRDKPVFGGTARPAQHYVGVRADKGGALVLDAGKLQGMTAGSVFALFTPETEDLDAAKPLARAEVVEVGLDEATLRLLPGASVTKLPPFVKGKEVEHNHGGERLRLSVEETGGLARAAEVLEAIRASSLVELAREGEGWDLRLRASAPAESVAGARGFLLERPDGSVIAGVAETPAAGASVADALRREARWRYAKSLENRNPQSSVKVTMRLVRVEATRDENKVYHYVRDLPDGVSPAVLYTEDIVAVDVMNMGTADAYVALFILSSDGQFAQLWPDRNNPMTDNFVSGDEKGKWVRLWVRERGRPSLIRITPPAGRDIFKIIVTTRHMGFDTLLRRGPKTDFEKLVGGVMRGDGPSDFRVADDWYTDSVSFETRLR